MTINPSVLTIRSKKLGVLLRDARLASGKSIEECAQVIRITGDQFEEYEVGLKSPSLPELEVLSYFLDVPLEHFWGDKVITSSERPIRRPDLSQVLPLRQRVVGALLRKARLDAKLSLEDLAEKAWSSPTVLEAFELGEKPIPLPDLELLCRVLDRSVREFQDDHGPAGAWSAQQRMVQEFLTLPPDLQAFISKPVNRPYLEVAQRLSEMSVEKLRAVAEGLLEITL